MDNVPAFILRRHLRSAVKVIHAVDDAKEIVPTGKEMLVNLLEHIAGVVDYVITGKPIKLHDRIRKLCATRDDPCPKDFDAIVLDHEPKLSTVPGKTLNNLFLIWGRLHIGGSKFIFDARIKFHSQVGQVAKNVMKHIWLRRELDLVAGS